METREMATTTLAGHYAVGLVRQSTADRGDGPEPIEETEYIAEFEGEMALAHAEAARVRWMLTPSSAKGKGDRSVVRIVTTDLTTGKDVRVGTVLHSER